MVTAALERASPRLEHTGHRVVTSIARRGLGVEVDVERMAEVLADVVVHAATASDPRTTIQIAARRAGERIELGIHHAGAGDARERLELARELVEQHGGAVRAECPGLGLASTFVIELPAIELARPERAPGPADELYELRGGASRARILVVDDHQDSAVALKRGLEVLGYRVAVAYDGPSALAIAPGFGPDIALLDLGLPRMDGYELARQLRAGIETRLVAITGYAQDADRDRSAEAGFDEHLVKPVDLVRLARLVERLSP